MSITDAGVAGFLRAAENPSHTKWNSKSIKEIFIYAPGTLTYVVEAARNLAALLAGDPREKDATIWAAEFSVPGGDVTFPDDGSGANDNRGGGTGPRNERIEEEADPETSVPPPPPPPPSPKRPYAVSVIRGGFAVKASGRPFSTPLPARLELQLAYHVRGRNPLARWVREDFDLTDTGAFPSTSRNCVVEGRHPNRLTLRIEQADFEFTTTGFDTHRELYCKPKLETHQPSDPENEPMSDADADGEPTNTDEVAALAGDEA